MECSIPPPLTEEALSFVLDELADDATLMHLAQCPACTRRFANLKRLETSLINSLGRMDCPAPQLLGDYYLGRLEPPAADAVRQHLASCPRCREELEMLTHFLTGLLTEDEPTNIIQFPSPPSGLTRANHVQTSGSLALKGAEDESAHDAKAGTANIFLETKPIPSGFLLTGQVLDSQLSWAGAVASVHQLGSPEQVCILDDMGEFRFELQSAASLNLYILSNTGVKLFVENLLIS